MLSEEKRKEESKKGKTKKQDYIYIFNYFYKFFFAHITIPPHQDHISHILF